MLLRKSCLLTSMILALSMGAFAQSNSDDDEWISSDSTSSTAGKNSSGSYDGSNDSEFANDEDYASAYARYKKQTTSRSEISKQRSEGFSQSIFLGMRVQGGFCTFLGPKSNGWGAGWNAGAGLIVKMPLFTKNLSIAPELTFNYRHYGYEKDMTVYTNKAKLDIMLFELPFMFRYTFDQYDFFVAAGVHLGLVLTGNTEFRTEPKGDVVATNADKRTNTFRSTNMEAGLAIQGGYMLSRNFHVDIRIVQSFTNLLNTTLSSTEQSFEKSTLLTFYTNLGLTYLF